MEVERTEYCFSCHQDSKQLSISLWDLETGTTRRIYNCDVRSSSKHGKGKIALLGTNYLLYASQTVPFIYVWNIKKVGIIR